MHHGGGFSGGDPGGHHHHGGGGVGGGGHHHGSNADPLAPMAQPLPVRRRAGRRASRFAVLGVFLLVIAVFVVIMLVHVS